MNPKNSFYEILLYVTLEVTQNETPGDFLFPCKNPMI